MRASAHMRTNATAAHGRQPGPRARHERSGRAWAAGVVPLIWCVCVHAQSVLFSCALELLFVVVGIIPHELVPIKPVSMLPPLTHVSTCFFFNLTNHTVDFVKRAGALCFSLLEEKSWRERAFTNKSTSPLLSSSRACTRLASATPLLAGKSYSVYFYFSFWWPLAKDDDLFSAPFYPLFFLFFCKIFNCRNIFHLFLNNINGAVNFFQDGLSQA